MLPQIHIQPLDTIAQCHAPCGTLSHVSVLRILKLDYELWRMSSPTRSYLRWALHWISQRVRLGYVVRF